MNHSTLKQKLGNATLNSNIYAQVEAENIAYFEQHRFSQESLNYALKCCAHFNSSFDFTLKIIELGANNIEFTCGYAISNYHYQLPQKLLGYYREQHHKKLNVFSGLEHNLTDDVGLILHNQTRFLPLVLMIIDGLPNHTQKVCHKDKLYESFETMTYASVYNTLLNQFLIDYHHNKGNVAHLSDEILNTVINIPVSSDIPLMEQFKEKSDLIYNLTLSDDERLDLQRTQANLYCIVALANKKFPVYDENAHKILHSNLEHYFLYRLQGGQMPQPQGLAHRTLLCPSKKFSLQINRLKAKVYYELAEHFKVPGSITCHMLDSLHEEDIHRRLPTDTQFAFFEQLEQGRYENSHDKNAQTLLSFFKHYFLIDKMKLERQLRMEIIDNYDDNDNKGNSYESHHRTIKI
jgi:hypothetical protein